MSEQGSHNGNGPGGKPSRIWIVFVVMAVVLIATTLVTYYMGLGAAAVS